MTGTGRRRLVLGLGIGDDVVEFAEMALPFPRAARQQALAETVEAVGGLWGSEPFTFAGRHVRLDGARVQSPPQAPRRRC